MAPPRKPSTSEPQPVEYVLVASIHSDEETGEPLPLEAVDLSVGHRQLRLEAGQVYTTSDADEIRALDRSHYTVRKDT